MDRLTCLHVFSEVARLRSFTLAATRLSLSRAAVTKHVAWLEKSLGAQLLKRTTKRVGLTDAGQRVLDGGQSLIDGYEAIEAEVKDAIAAPRGLLRVNAPVSFGVDHLLPLTTRFCNRYPDIQVALSTDDGRASPLAEGLDVTIRFATALEDASFIALPLVKVPQVLVAAPGYLKRAGQPAALRDLARHNCLVHTIKSPTGEWRFAGPDGAQGVRVKGSISASVGEALRRAALLGHGLSIHPLYMVQDDLAAGRLQNVLPATPPWPLEMTAIYSSRRHLPSRVGVFLDFLRDWAREPPPWAAPL